MIFTEEQKLFRQMVREFAETEIAPHVPEILETHRCPESILKRAGELGLLGVTLPEEVGGTGLGWTEEAIIFEEVSRVSPGAALHMELTMVTAMLMLNSPKAVEKYFGKLISGEIPLGCAYTPPCGQPNYREYTPSAEKVEGGYIFNGVRHFASNAHSPLIGAVSVLPDGSTATLYIESEWEGVKVHPVDHKLGIAGNDGATIEFTNVFVPEENVVVSAGADNSTKNPINNGWVINPNAAAQALGCAKGIFEKTVEFCKNRSHKFKPLSSMTGVHYKLAKLQTKITMAESVIYDCASQIDNWMKTQDPAEYEAMLYTSVASKTAACEMLVDVCTECLRLQGGIGFHDPMAWHYVGDSLDYCIMDTPTEFHYSYLARQMELV